MKATGIVRRIDDLGRVVIPKEIRRTMRIRESDPLEIYTNNEGEVIFKKYSAISEIYENAAQVADIIAKLSGCPVVVFDRDHVVAVAGAQKKEYMERRVSVQMEDLMTNRKQFFAKTKDDVFNSIEGINKNSLAALPIISAGDIAGAVTFLATEENQVTNDLQMALITAAAQFLGKQIEG
ncbi:MAG: AbrB/MazE/SpoVT family DNA-binding domain-containing protein [Oscillospiraceae bacterium]|jgi:AbrB family transcriptional regulator (stage V sporulation protein T)|nr:AbrB/MazE/SpoVT family DNA-binding domain-containing protein [Oscillospiraceae bacterium]